MEFEDAYIYFVKALEYVTSVSGEDKSQKSIAIAAGVSEALISIALKEKPSKKVGFTAQQKIANASGYAYIDFLDLGKSLLNSKNSNGKYSRKLILLNEKKYPYLVKEKPPPDNEITQMHHMLDEIYESESSVYISAIKSNLVAFSKGSKSEKKIDRLEKQMKEVMSLLKSERKAKLSLEEENIALKKELKKGSG